LQLPQWGALVKNKIIILRKVVDHVLEPKVVQDPSCVGEVVRVHERTDALDRVIRHELHDRHRLKWFAFVANKTDDIRELKFLGFH